ncbi:hypothetical protein B0A52_09001 [Exophiala mesophila]|uniref:ASX DEUBAD domain-containing protein n=1 Tax=Exophiala mesophila TaxID=212818 RepID=A0A438MSZ4_EXOME|nr:hypothetical protein B0A52_09001 [Exophiala mesophila]
MPPSSTGSKACTGPWSSQRVLNASSKLPDQDLLGFIERCLSQWDINYTEEEKRGIIRSLPATYQRYELNECGLLKCPLSDEFVRDDSRLKNAVARFKSEVAQGLHEKGWQKQATRAGRERSQGKFDRYLMEHIEETFGSDDQKTRGPGVQGQSQNDHDKVD